MLKTYIHYLVSFYVELGWHFKKVLREMEFSCRIGLTFFKKSFKQNDLLNSEPFHLIPVKTQNKVSINRLS